ncbi:myelin-oligodendrocyte glycoprotein-like isoform X2 [Trachinotus anak]|uniref:myelin-oligodendrocyte glycoprotein-like isoform X2 n=1 Tax=Trachinotus anak TaxID=443729 RepID=UPI0039F1AF32
MAAPDLRGLTDSSLPWTLILLRALACFSPAAGQHQMIGSSQPIIAAPGDDVILPCHLDPPLNVQRFTVEWSRPDLKPDPSDQLRRQKLVYLYRNRQEILHNKIPSYVGRTRLFTEELKRGNISLKILNVTSTDAGRYRCFIPKLGKESTIQLVVDPDYKTQTTETPLLPKDLQTPDPGVMMNGEVDRTRHIAWILPLCVVLCLAAGVGGFFIKQRCQKQNNCLGI